MTSLEAQRQFFSEEIRMCSNIQSAALVEALALVAREQFLPPGPWTIRGEGDMGPARQTRDADPRHVYHNISIAIDAARQLYNGAPGTVAPWIDWLGLKPGGRVLHVGCGLGYYTAIMAHVVGSTGHIRALEVDEALAQQAKRNLMPLAWVDARRGDGGETPDLAFDAVLIHAGVTHPLPAWLDALAVGPDGFSTDRDGAANGGGRQRMDVRSDKKGRWILRGASGQSCRHLLRRRHTR